MKATLYKIFRYFQKYDIYRHQVGPKQKIFQSMRITIHIDTEKELEYIKQQLKWNNRGVDLYLPAITDIRDISNESIHDKSKEDKDE